jgi:hypothetical protein
VQPLLSANNCRSCHNTTNTLFHANFNLPGNRAGDSAAVGAFLDYAAPTQSPFLLRLMTGSTLSHSLKLWSSATDGDAVAVVAYTNLLALAGLSHELVAQKVTGAPQVDGVADAAWAAMPALVVPAEGGFAGDITVTMRAMYVPGSRVYFLLEWNDANESIERVPWLKTATAWVHEEVAPSNFNNAQLPLWRQPPAFYRYEDKLAIIWNTAGATEVAGFNDAGCAVLCHVGVPGDARPLKYTNRIGEIADMWHWKLVRTNVVHRLDDQYVWWNRDLVVNANGGRSGDPGGGEYASNPLTTITGGATVPQYTSANQPAAPYYLVDAATAAQWAATSPGWTIDPGDIARATTAADNYAVNDQLAYAITTLKPNVDRSDVEAYGVHSGGRWTLEISRSLTTPWVGATPVGSPGVLPVDVQFAPGNVYSFGVAVFNNAQIEHSWSPGVYRFRLQP